MLNSYINKISHNPHDFGLGVTLPTISINYENKEKKVLIGLKYINKKLNKRNLYNINTKKLIGVIEYQEIIFNLQKINDSKKYKIYLLDE